MLYVAIFLPDVQIRYWQFSIYVEQVKLKYCIYKENYFATHVTFFYINP